MNLTLDSIVLGLLVGSLLSAIAYVRRVNYRADRAESKLKAKEINDKAKREINERSIDELIDDTNNRLGGKNRPP